MPDGPDGRLHAAREIELAQEAPNADLHSALGAIGIAGDCPVAGVSGQIALGLAFARGARGRRGGSPRLSDAGHLGAPGRMCPDEEGRRMLAGTTAPNVLGPPWLVASLPR
jgi:hypothetical protein